MVSLSRLEAPALHHLFYTCANIDILGATAINGGIDVRGEVHFADGCLAMQLQVSGFDEHWRSSFVDVYALGTTELDDAASCTVELDVVQNPQTQLLGSCSMGSIRMSGDNKFEVYVSWKTPTRIKANISDISIDKSTEIVNSTFNFDVFDVPGFRIASAPSQIGQTSLSAPPCRLHPSAVASAKSIVDCDAAQSCRLRNVLFSGTEHESIFYTFGDMDRKEKVACFTEPISTTVHRRFVRYMGKTTRECRPNSQWRRHPTRSVLLASIVATEGWCDDRMIFAFNIPKPTYYYHAIIEGAIPSRMLLLPGKVKQFPPFCLFSLLR